MSRACGLLSDTVLRFSSLRSRDQTPENRKKQKETVYLKPARAGKFARFGAVERFAKDALRPQPDSGDRLPGNTPSYSSSSTLFRS